MNIYAPFLDKFQVLHCDFVNGTKPVLLVGVDIIIFDIGLFHSLWGIKSCVAQHLDGGYGRFTWCICHILALLISLPFAFVSRPRPCALWPLLIQQSAYGVGLLILSLSALPRILPILTNYTNGASLFALAVYALGTAMNSFLLYVYWHWYWHVESMWNSARKLRANHIIINPNMRSKRTMIRHAPNTQQLNEYIVNSLPSTNNDVRVDTKNNLETNDGLKASEETETLTLILDENNICRSSIQQEAVPMEEECSSFEVNSVSDSPYQDEMRFNDRGCDRSRQLDYGHDRYVTDSRRYQFGWRYYKETNPRCYTSRSQNYRFTERRRRLSSMSNLPTESLNTYEDNRYYVNYRNFHGSMPVSERQRVPRRLLPIPPIW